MAKFNLKDTCTLTTVEALPAELKGVAGKKFTIDGKQFTTKADKKGGFSQYMVYVAETEALRVLAAGASKASPVVVEIEISEE